MKSSEAYEYNKFLLIEALFFILLQKQTNTSSPKEQNLKFLRFILGRVTINQSLRQ